MRWSIPIGRVFGITVRLHVTFLMLLAWVGFEAFSFGGASAAKWEVLQVSLVFACIVLHELGHSVVAQQLGVEVKSITLLPIGGVAALRSIPENPWHEIAITLAGPMVNAVIAAVLFPIVGLPAPGAMHHLVTNWGELARILMLANLLLFLFNFIPAFPMDGGRLLRAVLALMLPYQRATTIAVFVGQGIAILFVTTGLYGHPLVPVMSPFFSILIGVFIFIGAEGEEKMVRMRGLLRDIDVEDVMAREFAMLAPHDTVARGLEMVYQTGQDSFPVMDGDRLLGMVSRPEMLDAVNRQGAHVPVEAVMDTDMPVVAPLEKVSQVQDEVFNEGWDSAPVMQDGRLVGLLSPENISRYLLVQSGLKKARPRAAGRMPTPPPVIATVRPIAPPPPPAESVPPTGPA